MNEIEKLYKEVNEKIKEIETEFEAIGYNNLSYFQGRYYSYWLGERAILKK